MAGHICHCLTKMSADRGSSLVTISSNGHRKQTGGQFAGNVYSLALGLLELGVQRGDVVAIAALNSECYLEWFLAIAYIGGIVAPLNYRWSFEEVRWAVEEVGSEILVIDDSCIKAWFPSLSQFKPLSPLKIAVLIGSSSLPSIANLRVMSQDAIRRPFVDSPSLDCQYAPEEIVLICFTSGTTGKPKGVAISHTALIVQSLAKIAVVGYGEDDVYLHTSPLCHIGGISSAITMLMVGGCHVFMPKFDAKEALRAIEVHQVTSFITVPAIISDINSVLSREQGKWRGGASVIKILNGGGGLSINLLKSAAHIFPNATIISAYGMTEASSSITFLNLTHELNANNLEVGSMSNSHHLLGGSCVGKPASHVELTIGCGSKIKNQNRQKVGPILTRGPNLMVRYWVQGKGAMNSCSSSSFSAKWLDTGDIGYIDEAGNLWLVGRANDKIKTGGENVYPQEVEAIISQHPGISGVTVIGLPHPRLEEMVAACVRLQDNWRWLNQSFHGFDSHQLLSKEILHSYCRDRKLTGFKIPRTFIPWEKPFPVTASGKIRREEVKRELVISNSHQYLHSNL